MYPKSLSLRIALAALATVIPLLSLSASDLQLSANDTLESHGLSVFLFHSKYHSVFGDQKMSGLEIVFHEQRIATNGDVRLSPTPAQWDPIPEFKSRTRGSAPNQIIASCAYPDRGLSYHIDVQAEDAGFRISVQLDQPLPQALVGKAGFNLEFLPSAYFAKSFLADETPGAFPRHPDGPMRRDSAGNIEPRPFAEGHRIVLSPEDPLTHVAIDSETGTMQFFDGRNVAQNGWFVLRSLIPANATKDVVVWHVRAKVAPGWVRPPVVGYNQIGYTPSRDKISVIELDSQFDAPKTAAVLRLDSNGEYKEVFRGPVRPWGKWTRYQYARFDFSQVRDPGLYVIEYAGQRNGPFLIRADVYKNIWRPSLDIFLAEQMDHVKVREAYRIWHGASHLDDARQAPVNYTHFDGYAMPGTTDSRFAPGEHIPGLDVGGWYDAGDFDLRTQTHTRVVTDLVLAREEFAVDGDDTSVDETARYVQIHVPDGKPDVLQQVEHGVLYLLSQYKAFGHAIPGVVEPTLQEYTHLGDAASKTDGRIYDSHRTSDGFSSVPDDRWAFTTHITALNYDVASALAAASRVLRDYDAALATECLTTAIRVWDEEHKAQPVEFHSFNTTGGDLRDEEIKAAVELLIATRGNETYRKRLSELAPTIAERFFIVGWIAARAIPFMDAPYKEALESAARASHARAEEFLSKNPYGVPISLGTWGGSAQVAYFAVSSYELHQAFPHIFPAGYTLRALDYVLGVHPVSNVSLVSGVGTHSKLIGYGNNRADYTFIPGGLVPGVTVIAPDFPELTDSWPFFWYENEYVLDAATAFILTANAAEALAK